MACAASSSTIALTIAIVAGSAGNSISSASSDRVTSVGVPNTVSFLNTMTVFGTPTEVTLSELALEMLFPADPATIAIVKAMVEEGAPQAIKSGLQKAS